MTYKKTKQLTKRTYGPAMDSRQYRAKLYLEKVYRLFLYGSTNEDELHLEVVEYMLIRGN